MIEHTSAQLLDGWPARRPVQFAHGTLMQSGTEQSNDMIIIRPVSSAGNRHLRPQACSAGSRYCSRTSEVGLQCRQPVSYTHLTLPTNREV